jgi:hypothetical protein
MRRASHAGVALVALASACSITTTARFHPAPEPEGAGTSGVLLDRRAAPISVPAVKGQVRVYGDTAALFAARRILVLGPQPTRRGAANVEAWEIETRLLAAGKAPVLPDVVPHAPEPSWSLPPARDERRNPDAADRPERRPRASERVREREHRETDAAPPSARQPAGQLPTAAGTDETDVQRALARGRASGVDLLVQVAGFEEQMTTLLPRRDDTAAGAPGSVLCPAATMTPALVADAGCTPSGELPAAKVVVASPRAIEPATGRVVATVVADVLRGVAGAEKFEARAGGSLVCEYRITAAPDALRARERLLDLVTEPFRGAPAAPAPAPEQPAKASRKRDGKR